ncbi:CotH protein [Posidoniimonas corsicana]|uniref:CotH protein n=1 Tax=Posidoniimonas corsicana TaxID=1938618 RepID=A0A5C5V9R3_9BACT|nr:lamin tail domain-containing protein [Posidoniimonas corsicana]TWT35288.1 CotH protein [Posidoniimonas corsicana]
MPRRPSPAAPKNDNSRHGRRLQYETLEDRLALTVEISEFLAGNDSGLEDAAGHRHDWIELTNTGASPQNISGWSLTDDQLNLTKWQIPSTPETTSLAPGESLLVFASGASGEVGVVNGELHASFQLSMEPGYLGLVRADGTTVEDAYDLYPQQVADVSYGLGVGTSATTTETLITAGSSATGDGSPAKFRRFTGPNASVDDHWTEIDYVASSGDGWTNATSGLGYGYGSPWQDSTVSLGGEIAGYVRMPFTVDNAAQLTSLNLELRVDNGYIVYLNGREVQRERLPTMFKIGNDWLDANNGQGGLNSRENLSDSTITGSPAVIDLTAWLDTIEEGENVLAIYAANHTSDQGDYLVHAELTAGRAVGPVADSFMVTPTPGLENGAGYLGVIEDTLFSHDRGFYDSPFLLEITTAEPGTTIRYTTDGTRPTLSNGSTYSAGSPILVNPATLSYADAGVVTIRAAAFKEGYFPTNVDTQSYIFLDDVLDQDGAGLPDYSDWGYAGPDWDIDQSIVSSVGPENLKDDLKSIPTMSLVMDWEEMFGNGSNEGIYTEDSRWRNKSDERQASLEYFTADGAEEFQIDSVVEIQGHSSTNRWRSDKLSLQVKFKQPYDTKLESDTLFGNAVNAGESPANDFDTLILDAQYNYTFAVNNTSVQGPYATYVHDQVVADLSNLAGVPAAHGRWVHLYINGVYWGIYNAHERPSDSFAEEYFGGDKDDYLVVKGFEGRDLLHGGTQDKYLQDDGGLASQEAYQELIDQVDDNLASLGQYQEVAALLDIDDFVDYIIIHYYAGNYDWGELNWLASYNSVDPEGRWRFHSWDQEHAFPNDQNAPAGDGRNQDYDHTSQVANDFGEHEFGPTGIHHKLMASEEYRLRFSDRVEELMRNDGLLTPANAQAVWQARVDEISGAINGEAARWGDNRSPDKDGDDWATNAQYTSDHFFFANGPYQSRTDTVIGIFNNTFSPGSDDDEVGKTDWLVNLDAPDFNQFGGEVSGPFGLTMSNPNGGGTIYYTLDGSDPRTPGGGVSPTATIYTGAAVSLAETTQVRARVRDTAQSGTSNDWSAEVAKTFTISQSGLRIVELMYNPAAAGDLEYIELLNTGDYPVDLSGVQITDFSSGGYTFAAQMLEPGERIVVAQDVAAFKSHYPGVANVAATAFSGSLSNSGETVTLRDANNNVLQSFTYSDVAPWPTSPDGGGYSLEYIGPFDADAADPTQVAGDPYDNAANWRASLLEGGSPGTDGSASTLPGDFDSNGAVEQADYDVWRSTYGSTSDLRADGNNDGRVDAADYSIWRDNLGAVAAPIIAAVSVPAPAPQPAAEQPTASAADSAFAEESNETKLAVAFASATEHAESASNASRSAIDQSLAAAARPDNPLLLYSLRRSGGMDGDLDESEPLTGEQLAARDEAYNTLEGKPLESWRPPAV